MLEITIFFCLFVAGSLAGCRTESQMDYSGNDIATLYVPDVGACCAACETNPSCQGFGYDHRPQSEGGTMSCWLKHTMTGPNANSAITSGHKGGGGSGNSGGNGGSGGNRDNESRGSRDNASNHGNNEDGVQYSSDSSGSGGQTSRRGGRKQITENGKELIRRLDTWRNCADKNEKDKWIIGYRHEIHGHEGFKDVTRGDCRDKNWAEEWLNQDLQQWVDCVNDLVTVPLSCNEFGAMVAFAREMGCRENKMTPGFHGSTVRQVLNRGEYGSVCNALNNYNHINLPDCCVQVGVDQTGRRASECELFSRPTTEIC